MTVRDEERAIEEEFSAFGDWMEKYEYIIELGRSLPLIDEADKTEDNLIKGCQSRVWLSTRFDRGRIWFTADSDAIITKGIIALLVRVFNGRTPQEILSGDCSFVERIGLKENLTPTRANGLVSMIRQIRNYALAYSAQETAGEAGSASAVGTSGSDAGSASAAGTSGSDAGSASAAATSK